MADLDSRIDAFLAGKLGSVAEEQAVAAEWCKRAEAAEGRLAEALDAHSIAQRSADEWRALCNGQRQRAEAAEAALAERDKPCVWRQEADGWYMTQCENAFADMQGTYCPGCGHPIEGGTVTENELAAILKRNPDVAVIDTATPAQRPAIDASIDSDGLSAEFARLWLALDGPYLVTEYKFHPVRRWRFDFAHLATKTAIEINGGIWSGGRHVRGAGYLRDREKINTAQMLGWRVFELGTGQVTVDNVQAIINHVTEVTE